jgi:hypothetical protein
VGSASCEAKLADGLARRTLAQGHFSAAGAHAPSAPQAATCGGGGAAGRPVVASCQWNARVAARGSHAVSACIVVIAAIVGRVGAVASRAAGAQSSSAESDRCHAVSTA